MQSQNTTTQLIEVKDYPPSIDATARIVIEKIAGKQPSCIFCDDHGEIQDGPLPDDTVSCFCSRYFTDDEYIPY